jgi:O-glycosyl hydrolase
MVAIVIAGRVGAQTITIDTSPAGRQQVIDGFGTCLAGVESTNTWWQQLYFDDLGASMVRVDLTPGFRSPYSDNAYNSPSWGNAGQDGNYARAYTNTVDYQRVYSGRSAPIAVMGPNIETNLTYFVQPGPPGAVAQAGAMRRLQLGDFKLFGALWSPAAWVKHSSGNAYGGGASGMPAKGTQYPFIWLGNFAGGQLDASGTELTNFDDSAQGGTGPTSALTQFARCTAAYVLGFQRQYGVSFYSLSIQNELNFEEFYNSCTYPLSSGYIAALKAVRGEFDKHPELAPIKLMGPEDLMGGDPYSLWQYGSGSGIVHKNLQYLQNIAADSSAASALSFFCIHGYANDGTTATGSTPTQWNWWLNGWTTSPAAGIPGNVKGTAAYGKKSWMTETSGEAPGWLSPTNGFPNQGAWSIALKIQQALTTGQQSGWSYWQLTDGNAIGAQTLTDATQRGTAAKYVAAKHFFRFIRPNSVRVNVTVSNAPGLSASAYLGSSNSSLTIVLVNSSSNPITTQIQAPPAPPGLAVFQSFTSDNTALWVSNSVALAGGVASVNIPGYGVCTLVGQSSRVPVPPAITKLPQNASVTAGSTAQFACSATGDGPLSFQWLFNNLAIAGGTNSLLTLTNVQPFQAGQYSVQVTNAAGGLISFPATLQVSGVSTVPLVTPLVSAVLLGENVQLSFNANPGRIYSWLTSTNPTVWTIATSFVSASTQALWLVSPVSLVPDRYFRVSSP